MAAVDQGEVIPIGDRRAEASDPPVVIINVETGRIAEIPCGPGDAQYMSGDRLVFWSKTQRRAEIPVKHARRWRFYADFCADPQIAAKHGLTVQESSAYFEAFRKFMNSRGLGANSRTLPGLKADDIEKLWHPEARELRRLHKAAGGQQRMGEDALASITAGLKPGGKPEKKPKE